MQKMFTYMLNDNQFLKKFLILTAFISCANILINWSGTFTSGSLTPFYYILFFVGVFIMFVPYGYSIEILRTVMENNTNINQFPTLNPKENFIAGMNVVLSGILLLIVLFIVLLIMGVINNYTVNLFHGFISNILNVLTILMMLILSFFGIAMCCNYANKPSYFNFINFKDSVDIINKNVSNYFKYYIGVIVLVVISFAIMNAFAFVFTKIGYFGLVLYSILVAALWAYVTFILAYLFTKATK